MKDTDEEYYALIEFPDEKTPVVDLVGFARQAERLAVLEEQNGYFRRELRQSSKKLRVTDLPWSEQVIKDRRPTPIETPIHPGKRVIGVVK